MPVLTFPNTTTSPNRWSCQRQTASGTFPTRTFSRYSVYLLYWYRSTNTATCGTCSHILKFVTADNLTKVQILTPAVLARIYWYQSTNTDTCGTRLQLVTADNLTLFNECQAVELLCQWLHVDDLRRSQPEV